jgi:hypothetical protein
LGTFIGKTLLNYTYLDIDDLNMTVCCMEKRHAELQDAIRKAKQHVLYLCKAIQAHQSCGTSHDPCLFTDLKAALASADLDTNLLSEVNVTAPSSLDSTANISAEVAMPDQPSHLASR